MTAGYEALADRIRTRLPGIDSFNRHPDHAGPPPSPKLTEEECHAVEAELGFELPPVLRHIYRHVANGGFGPGYGVMGVGPSGFTDDRGKNVERRYLDDRTTHVDYPKWQWPERLLSICHFGCAVYHCVDGNSGEVVVWEPGFWGDQDAPEVGLFPTGVSVEHWFDRWSRGDTVFMYRVLVEGEPDWQNGSLASERRNRSS